MDDKEAKIDKGRRRTIIRVLSSLLCLAGTNSAAMILEDLKTDAGKLVEANRITHDLSAADLDHTSWNKARPVHITRYWSGDEAPPQRQAEARLLWSTEALLVRFVCPQGEPLVLSEKPQTKEKTIGLWDRDVCEIFIAPDVNHPEHYFEFEAAPTGEWLDLSINWKPDDRETDWNFHSGMTAAARIHEGSIVIAMRVPWKGLGKMPRAGERWRVNLFRCVGAGEQRGYMAWQPTHTEKPAFHIPQAFGWLHFKG